MNNTVDDVSLFLFHNYNKPLYLTWALTQSELCVVFHKTRPHK